MDTFLETFQNSAQAKLLGLAAEGGQGAEKSLTKIASPGAAERHQGRLPPREDLRTIPSPPQSDLRATNVAWQPDVEYGLPVIGPCNYRPVITAVITVITAPIFQLPVIGNDRVLIRVLPPLPPPPPTRRRVWAMATLRTKSHLQGRHREDGSDGDESDEEKDAGSEL